MSSLFTALKAHAERAKRKPKKKPVKLIAGTIPAGAPAEPTVKMSLRDQFEVNGEERLSTRQTDSLLRLLTGFARGGRLDGAYDDARVVR